jgi:antitoxin HicB
MARTTVKRKSKIESLEYQVNLAFDPRDEIYVARVPELENCHSHGDTPEEALSNVREAIELWIETAKAKHIPIPEPVSKRKFSGKFVLRTSVELHAQLVQAALVHGKSMNDLVVEILEEKIRGAS